MVNVTDEKFQELINQAISTLPQNHINRLENVAILYEYDPTPEQRLNLELRQNQTLFGLYEGVPLSKRQGTTKLLPDKITIFKNPISASVNSEAALKEQIRHTLWHEIAHFYGLGHNKIRELEA
ncbi:MAG: metallopeptidase family protein [Candidatus Saccharimonadales bacterium]